jgi:hypothetical protein
MYAVCTALFALSLLAAPAADDAKALANVKGKAEEAVKLFLKGDFKEFTAFVYPPVLKNMGGRDKVVEQLTKLAKDMKEKGLEFRTATVADPTDSATAGDERYVVVPYTLEMKAPGGKLTGKTYLLAISTDKGKTWAFVDGAGLQDEGLRKKALPNLPARLKLPKVEKPTFEKDK